MRDNRASVRARNGQKMILGVVLKVLNIYYVPDIFIKIFYPVFKVKISRFIPLS